MTPGSIQFRKHCERLLPQRGQEQKAHYIARLARHFGLSTSRMTVLYYDQRKDNARFTPEEYTTIFLSSTGQPRPSIIQKNYQDLEELKELKRQIRKEILNELAGTFQKLGEADAR